MDRSNFLTTTLIIQAKHVALDHITVCLEGLFLTPKVCSRPQEVLLTGDEQHGHVHHCTALHVLHQPVKKH